MEILILVTLIVVNGFFAMSEIALITAHRARLAPLAEEGDPSATVAMQLGEQPTQFLSTIQIGITSIGILNGIIGEAALAEPLAEWLMALGLAPKISVVGATFLVVVIITYVSIVVGELVPKRLGQINPEAIARRVARPIRLLALLSHPFVQLLAVSTTLLLRLMGQREARGPSVTEEEIHAILNEGSEAGVIEKNEYEMVRRVLRLDDRLIGSLMVPRLDIVWLDINRPLEENLALMAASDHSRFPVGRDGLDDILGWVSAPQVCHLLLRGHEVDLTQGLQAPVYVPEFLTGMELFAQFRAFGTPLVFVINEYSELQGIVTREDLIEAVTGEFQPNDVQNPWAVQREDGSWLLDGLIPLPELKERLSLKTVPEEEKRRYHTLSGMIMALLGNLPNTGDIVTWAGWQFEVIDLDGKRIDKVLAYRQPEAAAGQQAEMGPEEPPTGTGSRTDVS